VYLKPSKRPDHITFLSLERAHKSIHPTIDNLLVRDRIPEHDL
jgi:hypothetical protein